MSCKHQIVIELEMVPGMANQAASTLNSLAQAYLQDLACFELPGLKVTGIQLQEQHVPKGKHHGKESRAND